MDKCLGIMEGMGDFATLNSFNTIQRTTGKLPEEMQRDWVRWAFGVLRDTGKQAKFRGRWSSCAANLRKQTPCM